MINIIANILTAANINHQPIRFFKEPQGTYAVYFDTVLHRGADDQNNITEHECRIELYSDVVDPTAEAAIEMQLDAIPIAYEKETQWIQSQKKYQTNFHFDYVEKRR